jgi:DNA-binding MarR family transcriptional regulator
MQTVDCQTYDDLDHIHPKIHEITDALTFKVARLSALNERAGGLFFKAEHDITLIQWRVLGLTAALGPVPSRELREILFMDKGQFSRVVKQLVLRDLLETAPSQTNASAVELRLTREGQILHTKLLRFTAVRNEAVVSVLTKEECTEFLRLLEKVDLHNQRLQRDAGIIS